MDEAAASQHEGNMQELLANLEARFKGRRCYLGQYVSPKPFPSAPESGGNGNASDSGSSGSSPVVGSVAATLEPPNRLVLGAFLDRGLGQAWEYWEGEFGPSELASHRDSLGWDGHSLEALADCFACAVEATKLPPPEENRPCSEGALAAADEHQQRPPEFSSTAGVVETDRKGEEEPESGGVGGVGCGDDDGDGGSATGTLDLHYARAGIVGSWEVSRVQTGVSAALMHSMHRSIRSACGRQLADTAEAPASSSGSADAGLSRAKASGAPKFKRKRVAATGAKLAGVGPSAEA
ncbi:expressed unknown protein [Ectocarpus siliculosus]|uniref:Uncharacterized protein n=1 Tax=Ectocarpus siliculosus TaxID=2880 RepID=D7FXQ2_ECTSI|nr:expressed unknown protein [Ectocarpus siliculosus]|eukprot:CBJ26419.1 expressed unknown protein [Ectocarpus siliculosus]